MNNSEKQKEEENKFDENNGEEGKEIDSPQLTSYERIEEYMNSIEMNKDNQNESSQKAHISTGPSSEQNIIQEKANAHGEMEIFFEKEKKVKKIISYESNKDKNSFDNTNHLEEIEANLRSIKKENNISINNVEIGPNNDVYLGGENIFQGISDKLKKNLEKPPNEFENDEIIEYDDDDEKSKHLESANLCKRMELVKAKRLEFQK